MPMQGGRKGVAAVVAPLLFQGGVTPINSILPPATGVKNFDRQFRSLSLDFAKKKDLTVDCHFLATD